MNSMKKNQEKSSYENYGNFIKELLYLITILFCALRSCEVIHWEWYWVMSPIFLSWIVGVVLMTILVVVLSCSIKKSEKDRE